MTLQEAYSKYCVTGPDVGHGDKGGTHSYIDEYARLLEPYRDKCVFMEIGLARGLSLSMWREWMPNWTIVGVDLSFVFDTKPHTDSGTIMIAADATKPQFLETITDYTFDVIIDDASHMAEDQEKTFRLLKHKMNKGGIYIIEDIIALDQERKRFAYLHSNCEILDLRAKKGRFDDVMVVYRF